MFESSDSKFDRRGLSGLASGSGIRDLSNLREKLLDVNAAVDDAKPKLRLVAIALSALLIAVAVGYNFLIPHGPSVDSLPRAKSQSARMQVGETAQSTQPLEVAPGAQVIVQIAGAVKAPGVFKVDANARVNDAVLLAGGLLPTADSARVNLAAKLTDGQLVVVPKIGEAVTSVAGGVAGAGGGIAGSANGLININTADQSELEKLPGVGPTLAQAILDFRKQNGPFKTLDQLNDVKGIGDAKFSQIKTKASI